MTTTNRSISLEQGIERDRRLSAAREGVVKALEELESEAQRLREHVTCDQPHPEPHDVYGSCGRARVALEELREAEGN